MKKNILKKVCLAMIAALLVANVYYSMTSSTSSELFNSIAKVKIALASGGEGSGGEYQSMCYCTPWELDFCCVEKGSDSCTNDC